ncbi:hypothetical protein ACEZDB_32455 [Streptacidiphilus sp. N1-3]|uniref:Nucleotidyl transferase domain-containing protein n=1 Tax=Streptacidiphilus alkalitolerans TaxID=3342712 RepID=A0ABV6XAP9_9ACTN
MSLDATLDLLAPHADRLRVVAVVGEDRETTVRHLRRRCAQLYLPLAVTFPDPKLPESTGAVLSAEAWFGPATLVLLADQVLHHGDPRAVAELLDLVHGGAEVAWLTAAESDPARLAVDGALLLQPDAEGVSRVVDYADKPGLSRAGDFNAVWFGYAFARTAADAVLNVLDGATLRRPPDGTGLGLLHRSPAVDVGPFADLGTWPAVTSWWRDER